MQAYPLDSIRIQNNGNTLFFCHVMIYNNHNIKGGKEYFAYERLQEYL